MTQQDRTLGVPSHRLSADIAQNSSGFDAPAWLRQHLPQSPEGSAGRELASLGRERDPELFGQGLLNLAGRQAQQGNLPFAAQLYQALSQGGDALPAEVRRLAQRRVEALQGHGEIGDVAEAMVGRFAQEATEPTSLLAMGVAGAAFKVTRLATLSRLVGNPSTNFLTRGFGARALASVAGFGVEATVFPLAGRLANAGLGRSQDWSRQALGRDLASSFLFLGAMKMSGWAAGAGFNRIHGINPLSGQATRLGAFSAISRPLVPQLGMLGGIMLGHEMEVAAGLREAEPFSSSLVHSLGMLVQFNVAGRATRGLFGERWHRWENQLEMQTQTLSQRALGRPHVPTLNFGPELALATAGGPGPRRGGESGSIEALAAEPLRMQSLGGEGGGSRESSGGSGRRIDPEQTLAVLPVGTLTPHGNERTTHQRAVGDPAWVAEVAALNGHVEYKGDGVYVDKASQEPLSIEQINERYGAQVRSETGFRELATEHPIETPWAGQIPTGLRGPEGETEGHLLQAMGLSKREIKSLRFDESTSYLHGSDQFALQGLYALYRSAVQWGLPLDEIVGRDPRRMGISVAAGLGGMNNLIDLITAATKRRMRDGAPTTTTDPATGPLVLPALLIDSMQGLFTAILGPKGGEVPTGLTADTVIRTVGRIPVDVGACATGYKAFANAADMFRPGWPGQTPTDLAFFGSAEAAHGRIFARSEATGFNAMKAMETTERLRKRNGRVEDGYAPLTTDVMGFWPSEGAGVGGLMRLSRAIELGLPVDAAVAGYSITGDQGGKKHPAGLGLGGVSSLLESLHMARQWQGLEPRELQYMNLHGTGTPENNKMEPSNLLAVLDAFGYEGPLRLSAYKALLGHGLGAAGSMEIGLLTMALRQQLAPGAFNLEGRQIDPTVQALGDRVIVSADAVHGPLRFVGGQSQGFAGNNGSALFRSVDDATLHEVYGFSIPQIEAYRSRLSERRDRARQWEEDIRTGRATIGQFLSWFGLGAEPPPAPPVMVVLPGEGEVPPSSVGPATRRETPASRASSEPPAESLPPTSGELAQMMSQAIYGNRAPAVIRGIGVDPSQMIVSLGRGQMLTTRGTARATRSAAMRGIDHPLTLAYLSEDFGLTRYAGRDSTHRESWVRADNGERITPEQIAHDFGERLLQESGIRDIPLENRPAWTTKAVELVEKSATEAGVAPDQIAKIRQLLLSQAGADRLPVRHGGLLPEPLRGGARLLDRMGLANSRLKGTAFENQSRNLKYASDMGAYGLFAALGAQTAFGRPLQELFPSSLYGAMQGSAFPGMDRLAEILDQARSGRDSVTYMLQSSLPENARGLYLNLMMPHFNYDEMKTNPRAIERILPPNLGPSQMANTGGVNLACSAACASGLYALFAGRLATIRAGVPGEYPMDAFMLMSADATFSPYSAAPLTAGFSRKAPMTVDAMVLKLAAQGRIPAEVAELPEAGRDAYWREQIPEALRRQAMSESSAPFTRFSKGLVVSEGAAALPWMNFQRAIELGVWPSSRLLGIHVNTGEGGAPNLAAMDQGVVNAVMVALGQARAHGMTPQVWQAHGTSTDLNNTAEVMSVYAALRAAGVDQPMAVSAIKGLVGHTMGAASAIDLVMGVHSLLEGRAPGLFNFRTEDIEPKFATKVPAGALDQLRFSAEQARDFDSILITSEGFLAADAAAVLGRFPQDAGEARELLRDYGVPAHQRAEWSARAIENRARAEEMEESLRRSDDYIGSMDALRYRP